MIVSPLRWSCGLAASSIGVDGAAPHRQHDGVPTLKTQYQGNLSRYDWAIMMTEMEIRISGYIALFEQAADKRWSAMVPQLPTIITCGDTLEEAMGMVAEAIELWIEVAKEKGREIPVPLLA